MKGFKPIFPQWPAPDNVRSAITTRTGGHSRPPKDSLNLAFHVGDDPEVVRQNWQRVTAKLSLPSPPQLLQQVHGVEMVVAGHAGAVADGSYTSEPGVVCAVQTADCLPILLCNTLGTQVAAVHAGWRGLAEGIVEEAVGHFTGAGGGLMAYLGPAISQQFFEVGAEVRDAFLHAATSVEHQRQISSGFSATGEAHWYADLYQLARIALRQSGVTAIYGGGLCTYADRDQFYSYRRDGDTGRMATMIWLEGSA